MPSCTALLTFRSELLLRFLALSGCSAVWVSLGAAGRNIRRRAWIPVAAALALLAMLGAGEERVDVLAHLFGFLFGGVLGFLSGFVTPRPPGFRIQWACGTAAFALVVWCWFFALR